jgi:L-aminopeptidase/D-esterase-like protein
MMKSGFGLATHVMEHLIVTVAAVVNSRGDVVNSDGSVLAGARAGDSSWQAENDRFRRFPDLTLSDLRTNTTLVVVMTNANLNKVDAYRVAQRAHDGMAIAIRPSHTTHEGDTAFTLATNRVEAKFDDVANIAVELVAEAIRNAVLAASSLSGVPGLG